MINKHQQQNSVLTMTNKTSQRNQSSYISKKTESLNEIPVRSLEHQLFSFQDLQSLTQCENLNVEKDLSNFKKYLNQSPTFQKQQSQVTTKTESVKRLKVVDDQETFKMKKNLESKMIKAQKLLQEMKGSLKEQQQKKNQIILKSHVKRSQYS